MGHSVIQFNGREALLDDLDLIAVWILLLKPDAEFYASRQLTDNVTQLHRSVSELLEWAGPGCLNMALDEFLQTSEDLDCFGLSLQELEKSLRRHEEFVPEDYLNTRMAAPGIPEFAPFPKGKLLVAIQKLRDLLG